MAVNRQTDALGERKGIQIYERNPSIPPAGELRTRTHQTQVAKGKDAMIVSGSTGELLGKSMVAFMHSEEVDQTRFVKVFLDGVKRISGLSKAGLSVFEVVYAQARENVNADQIVLSAYHGKQAGLSDRTFYRGVRDLLEKEILYASPSVSVYFLNIRYLFNGNRLHFITSYHLKESGRSAALELGLDGGGV
jgi:hypothetical protein